MPSYTYRCLPCDREETVVKKVADLDREELCTCGLPMDRVIGSPYFRLQYDGRGFLGKIKNNYTKMKPQK